MTRLAHVSPGPPSGSRPRLPALAAPGELEIHLERVPLTDVDQAWERQQEGPDAKLVIVPGG